MNVRNTVKLGLKKIYFDQILSGEKKVEYRKFSNYYLKALVHGNLKFIIFYNRYYKDLKMSAMIEKIEVVPNHYPPEKYPEHLNTPKVFAIHLKDAEKCYNGWTNYYTWLFNVHRSNDEALFNQYTRQTSLDEKRFMAKKIFEQEDVSKEKIDLINFWEIDSNL